MEEKIRLPKNPLVKKDPEYNNEVDEFETLEEEEEDNELWPVEGEEYDEENNEEEDYDDEGYDEEAEEELFKQNPLKAIWLELKDLREALTE
jgi:hypothetical protein